ncbi:UNVERIFIED_CONTAM: hypothetical protein K2H54_045921 [Gekko kuhli]
MQMKPETSDWVEMRGLKEGNMESAQSTASAPNEIQANQPQALHYALANAQQVQIHQIGEDGQVQVGHLHIAQVPQGEQVQITQDSEGNLQIHQVHVGQDGQMWSTNFADMGMHDAKMKTDDT